MDSTMSKNSNDLQVEHLLKLSRLINRLKSPRITNTDLHETVIEDLKKGDVPRERIRDGLEDLHGEGFCVSHVVLGRLPGRKRRIFHRRTLDRCGCKLRDL